jgi:SAM-dependent methyltransferase
MPPTNNALFQDAAAYEQLVGRWSHRLAPLLIGFGGLADGDRVLDVGCGTGNLTFAVPGIANVGSVTGIDYTNAYLDAARARNADPRIGFEYADARALPFADNSFDRAFSLLVLQFIPEPERAVGEMRRVVRPGETITAATWDAYSGLPQVTILWHIATVLDPSLSYRALPRLGLPEGLATLWREAGLIGVEQTSLSVRVEFPSFDDYWYPFTTGEGPPGQFVAGLSPDFRARLKEHIRRTYLFGLPDGPRSFTNVVWACCGTVP